MYKLFDANGEKLNILLYRYSEYSTTKINPNYLLGNLFGQLLVTDNSHNILFPGRPEKLPDVCYSWWVLASLKIIGRLHWINKVELFQLRSLYLVLIFGDINLF